MTGSGESVNKELCIFYLFIYGLSDDAVGSSDYAASDVKISVNNEL
jgi:hypothetical protein